MTLDDALIQERPLARVPDVPHWLENFAWDAFDPVARVAVWVHCGRWFRDPTVWREFVLVVKDGREYFGRRAFGRLDDPHVLGAAGLRLTCETPRQRWRLRYHGAAVRGAIAPDAAPPADVDARLLSFDLDWEAAGPLVDFGHGTEPGAAASHYEQGGTLRGTVSIDGETIAFDGRSFRDHTRGPRTLEPHFGRHLWIHGTFPSGRTLSSLAVETPDGRMALNDLFVTGHDGALARYAFVDPPFRASGDDPTRPYVLRGVDAGGAQLRVEAAPAFWFPIGLAPPMDLLLGHPRQAGLWRMFEMPTRLAWDGEQAWGHTEFTLPRGT
ncbi:MAG TPA: hypothetical protein VJM11_16600 [Nevskiaceae bacterium]|nr:hypothetical protein [Nevskiaceae bacterium]